MKRDDPIEVLRQFLDQEMREYLRPTYTTRGGCTNPKTDKQREIERQRCEVAAECVFRVRGTIPTPAGEFILAKERVQEERRILGLDVPLTEDERALIASMGAGAR